MQTDPATAARPYTPLWRSASLRIAVLGLMLMAASLVTLVMVTGHLATQQWRDTILAAIEADRRDLLEIATEDGTLALAERLDQRLNSNPRAGYYYLAYDPELELGGNLRSWPTGPPVDWAPELIRASVPAQDGQPALPIVLQSVQLPDGATLFIGREVQNLALSQFRTQRAAWAIMALAGLALGIGFALAVWIVRRIETLRSAAENIVETADLTLRIDAGHGSGEFDRLGHAFNRMLTRIEGLMELALHANDAAAHDMRTPLTRLRHRLSHMAETLPDAAAEQDEITAAIADIDGLQTRLDALLRLSRIRSGEARSRFRMIDLPKLLHDLVETYEPLAEEAGLTLTGDWPDQGLTLLGDQDLIFQALANLTENAIRHAPVGSTLKLGGLSSRHGLDLWVADQGPGLAEPEIKKVTTAFAQGSGQPDIEPDIPRPSNSGNHGLGLAIVSAIAELHDGSLKLENTNPGLIARLSFPIR